VSAAEPDPHTTPPSRSLRWREPERERSPAAADVSSWLADAARLLAMARRLGVENTETRALQRRLVADLVLNVQRHGPLHLDVTPRSIVMGDDTVFAADHSNAPTGERGLERELSWILHRDGLRALKLEKGLTEAEAATFLDVLLLAAPGDATDEDLVTMLWESAFAHVGTVTEEANVVRLNPLTGRPGSTTGRSCRHRRWTRSGCGRRCDRTRPKPARRSARPGRASARSRSPLRLKRWSWQHYAMTHVRRCSKRSRHRW
jgi:hypothetical protein